VADRFVDGQLYNGTNGKSVLLNVVYGPPTTVPANQVLVVTYYYDDANGGLTNHEFIIFVY
jgi:hypothetical protein